MAAAGGGERWRWRWQRRRAAAEGEAAAGYAVMLALLATTALLVSSLSVHTAVLQGRSSAAILARRRGAEDALVSAAQLVAGRLPLYPCLISLDRSQWNTAGCIGADELASLQEGTLPPEAAAAAAPAGRYRLMGYTPPSVDPAINQLTGATLDLHWQPTFGPSRQRRFRLQIVQPAASPLQLQLRGFFTPSP